MSGTEKLPLLVIGKSSKPRAFKNKEVPFDYKANRKAWMTGDFFEEWLKNWDRKLKRDGRKVLLFLDNFSGHSKIQLELITIKFLPPNTTAASQPMDQGIIQNLKVHYRRFLLRQRIATFDAKTNFKMDLLKALQFLRRSWSDVKPETVTNCAGFFLDLGAVGGHLDGPRQGHHEGNDHEDNESCWSDPPRKYIWLLSSMFLLLALIIILHSALIIVGNGGVSSVEDPMFIIFSEVLAWLLILISLLGLKAGCMAAEAASSTNRQAFEQDCHARSSLATIWDTTNSSAFFHSEPSHFDMPGAVHHQEQAMPSEFLYPPPPPRYSSLDSLSVSRQPNCSNNPDHQSNCQVYVGSDCARPAPLRTNVVISILSPPPPYLT